jgi:pantoate kinase
MHSAAACPGFVTGIFTIGKGDAAGAGFAIDKMVETRVQEGKPAVLINGKRSPAPVSKKVMAIFSTRGADISGLSVSHKTSLPIGFGLGTSAAGALSLSLALNDLLGCGFSRKECVKIAHDAEVACGTGLSGVDAVALGGAVFRKSLSSPVQRLHFPPTVLHFAFFSPIRTASIVRGKGWEQKVNRAGNKALLELSGDKSWGGFVHASRQFAIGSSLGDWCRKDFEKNTSVCMPMLGRALFSEWHFIPRKKPLLQMKAKVYAGGARLL